MNEEELSLVVTTEPHVGISMDRHGAVNSIHRKTADQIKGLESLE